MGLWIVTWPPVLIAGVLTARDFVREAIDAHRQGLRFSETRLFGMTTVSITLPWVRVKFNEESYGIGIEDAAALAGVNPPLPMVPVPRLPIVRDAPARPGMPAPRRELEPWEHPGRRDVRGILGADGFATPSLPEAVREKRAEVSGLRAFREREGEVGKRAEGVG